MFLVLAHHTPRCHEREPQWLPRDGTFELGQGRVGESIARALAAGFESMGGPVKQLAQPNASKLLLPQNVTDSRLSKS